MKITNYLFISNSAYDGATIYLFNRGSPLLIYNAIFIKNSGISSIITIVNGIAIIDNIQFIESLNTILAVSLSNLTIHNNIIQNSHC